MGAVVAWASYNLGAKIGLADGFRPADLTLLRYGGGGILFLPVFIHFGWRDLGGIGWPRGLVLTALAGPIFGLLVNFGFVHAPLSHGVVLAPAAGILVTIALTKIVGKAPVGSAKLIGAAMLVTGLVVLAAAPVAKGGHGASTQGMMLVGDASFFASGSLWGGFTFLLKRWDCEALRAAGTVGVLSGLAILPVWLALTAGAPAPVDLKHVLAQLVLQGALGGCLGIVAYVATVRRLGASTAALFPALTPPVAIALGIPMLHEYPSAIQLIGVAVALCGIMIALGLFAKCGQPDRHGAAS
jgi:drug/metabolite transporter (DMT)-like permease